MNTFLAWSKYEGDRSMVDLLFDTYILVAASMNDAIDYFHQY